MPVTISGNGIVTGLAVGGLRDGVVDADTLANNAVTTNKIFTTLTSRYSKLIIGSIPRIISIKVLCIKW